MPNKKGKRTSTTVAIQTSYCSICCRQFQSKTSNVAFRLRRLHEQKCVVVPDQNGKERRREQYLSFIDALENMGLVHLSSNEKNWDARPRHANNKH